MILYHFLMNNTNNHLIIAIYNDTWSYIYIYLFIDLFIGYDLPEIL
jgi:hypothetical protein